MAVVHLVTPDIARRTPDIHAVFDRVPSKVARIQGLAAALHAPGGLLPRLLFGKALLHLPKVVPPFPGRALRHRAVRNSFHILVLRLRDGAEVIAPADERGAGTLHLPGPQVPVDRLGGKPPVGDGVDHRGGAVHRVAAGEYAGKAARHRGRVRLDGARGADGGAAIYRFPGEQIRIGLLADGGIGEGARDLKLGTRDGQGPAPPASIGFAELHADTPDPRQPAGRRVPDRLHRRDEHRKTHSFLLRRVHFLVEGRHLLAGPAVKDRDLLRAAADGGPCGVHGGVPSPHHHDLSVQLPWPVELGVPQEVQGRFDPPGILARHAQLLAKGGAWSQEDRVESLLPQSPQRELPAEPAVTGDFHTEAQDHVDVRVELLPGQTVRGNPVPEHPAQAGHRLVDRDRVALQGEVVRAGQARRTAPHDGNPLPRGRQPLRVDARVPGHETLHLVDPDGFVHQVAAARRFALSHAHPSADDGQGVALPDQAQGLPVVAKPREAQISLDVDAGRARQLAGTRAVGIMIGKEQRERGLPGARDPVAAGYDLHSVPDPGRAGGQEPARVLDLDHAKEAGAERRMPGLVAQGRDRVQLLFADQFEEGLPGGRRYRPSVDRELHRQVRPVRIRIPGHSAILSAPRRNGRP